MKGRLRAIRVAVAWVCGVLFAVLFLGPPVVAERLAATLPRTQVGPGLFRLLAEGSLAAGVLLGLVVLLTLVGGRLYCAACCPLGVLQDALRFLTRQVPGLRRWQERPSRASAGPLRQRLRWGVMVALIAAAVCGVWSLAIVLEPFGAFGRIATQLGLPVTGVLRGALSAVLERADIFVLSAATTERPDALAVAVTAVCLVGLVVAVALGGRVYCTALCPVGTGLGLLAQAAPLRVRFEASACNHCGVCARRCRSSCIEADATGGRIDVAACVACMDCVAVCPVGAIRYGFPARPSAPVRDLVPDVARRELLGAVSAAVVAGAATPLASCTASAAVASADGGPVSPPGSGSREHFVERCTACQLCVHVCPTHVLQPAVLEYGLAGVLQPRLSFRHGFCEYDCRRCTAVCPNGALRPLTIEEKRRTQLGVARLYKDRCIVYCRGEACGACVEVCPTHAVYSRDEAGLLCPEMAAGACIGCGACEFACPVGPKAIAVHASPEHGRAALPSAAVPAALPPEAEPPPMSPADFPF